MRPYADPFDFIANSSAFDRLAAGFHNDICKAAPIPPLQAGGHHAAYLLPDEAWARRAAGIFANKLANDNPINAHAVLTSNLCGDYTVSVRAPIADPQGADTLCLKFETGGGRRAAAGIDRLPQMRSTGSLRCSLNSFLRTRLIALTATMRRHGHLLGKAW
jgi:hypothetical protein